MRVLMWNVADLPVWVNPVYGNQTRRKQRHAQELVRRHGCHVVLLQEAFAAWEGAAVPRNDGCSLLRSGLAAFGAEHVEFHAFREGTGEDWWACKGVQHLRHGAVHVLNTHLQANAIFSSHASAQRVRQSQMDHLWGVVARLPPSATVVMGGDFNHAPEPHAIARPAVDIAGPTAELDHFRVLSPHRLRATQAVLPATPLSDHAPLLLQLEQLD